MQSTSIARAQAIADRLAEMADASAEQRGTPGNANSYPPANGTAAGAPPALVSTSVAIPGISIQAPPQQTPAGYQQPSSSGTEARQRRRASKFDQPAGEPRAAGHLSLPPPPPLHSATTQEAVIQTAAPVQGLSAQASPPLPGPPPAHSMSASESAESMRARAQAVAARFAAAAAAEEDSQAAAPATSATAQRPTALQQSAAAASEFEDDADPFKGLPPPPAKSTSLPRPLRPDPAGHSFSSSKADTIPPAAASPAPSAVPPMPPPHLSAGMWPRPAQPPGGWPLGPPPRPISGPRPPPGPYPAHPQPQHYPSHLQVRPAGCGLLQRLCFAMPSAFIDPQAVLCDSLTCSLHDGLDRTGPGNADVPATPPTARHAKLAGAACWAAFSEDARSACLGPQSRCRSFGPASILVSNQLVMI